MSEYGQQLSEKEQAAVSEAFDSINKMLDIALEEPKKATKKPTKKEK